MLWDNAPDITRRINFLVEALDLSYIRAASVHCFRSAGSSSKATARIWSLPTIWQQALSTSAHYCLEVISEKFDGLSPEQQEKVLIHELLHIPKSFSGSLRPHRNRFHRSFREYHRQVDSLYNSLVFKSYSKSCL